LTSLAEHTAKTYDLDAYAEDRYPPVEVFSEAGGLALPASLTTLNMEAACVSHPAAFVEHREFRKCGQATRSPRSFGASTHPPRLYGAAVCTLERLDTLSMSSSGLYSQLGDEDEPDEDERVVAGLASLRLTRLDLVDTACLPALPTSLCHLRLEHLDASADVMARIGELTHLTHLDMRQCGSPDLGHLSSLNLLNR
jgi:hypothetical protein